MIRKRMLYVLTVAIVATMFLMSGQVRTNAGKSSRFDRLTEKDKEVFSKRFEKEIWPLLIRNGKDGCVGCHNLKHQSTLRFSGKADKDFRKLLSDGFFLVKDPGGMLQLVSTTNPRQKMPPGKRKSWTKSEIERLRQFVTDVAKKQRK